MTFVSLPSEEWEKEKEEETVWEEITSKKWLANKIDRLF
jgi:hypothetical protein